MSKLADIKFLITEPLQLPAALVKLTDWLLQFENSKISNAQKDCVPNQGKQIKKGLFFTSCSFFSFFKKITNIGLMTIHEKHFDAEN